MPRAKRTSASFNPNLILVIEEGCRHEVRLNCGTPNEAIRLRQEMNKLRAALREEGHSNWRHHMSAGIYIDKKNPAIIIIKPKAYEFKDVLDKALDKAGIPRVEDPPTNDPVKPIAIDDLLGDLRKYEPKT